MLYIYVYICMYACMYIYNIINRETSECGNDAETIEMSRLCMVHVNIKRMWEAC